MTQSKATQTSRIDIRWLIRRDMPKILRIEQAAFANAWSEEDFLCCLRARNCIGMVAERDHEIVGFIVYDLHRTRLAILNLAVDPALHRCGIGTAIIARMKDKLSQQRRTHIRAEVRETNIGAQLFLRSMGFRAVRVFREMYEDTDEDCYLMEYHVGEPAGPVALHNQVSEYLEQ